MPGVPTCSPGFTTGNGSGFAIGALYQFPVTTRTALQLRAGYSLLGGSLSTQETIGNAVENGTVVDAVVEHRIDPTLGLLSFEPTLSWYPLAVPLSMNFGVQTATFIRRRYRQNETLTRPSNATFTSGEAIRNASEGNIEETNTPFISGIVGVGYDIPLSDDLTLVPEMAYHRGLTDILSDSSWKTHALRLGLSLKMRLGEPSTQSSPGAPAVVATVNATGLYSDSSERPIAQVRVEEFLGTQLHPLLNYLFFDNNSATIPERYARLASSQTRAFSIDDLHQMGAMQIYHQLLNIVGRRMLQNPTATITLVGTNSDEGAEKGNDLLSHRRAEAVRDYLRENWGIAENRMKIEKRGLPARPSNINEPDGIVENRRVEIHSDNWRIIEPVLTSDTLRTADPPVIRFRSNVESETGVESWKLTAGQQGRTLKEFSGSGAPPATLDWHLEEDQSRIPRIPTPIDYRLELTDVTGRTHTLPNRSIPTDQITIQRKRSEHVADRQVDRYSLILFDFATSELNESNRRIIDLISNRITIKAKVSITGTTDRLGDASFNQRLSLDRANVTAQALGTPTANIRGTGETMLYDNDLPEGRFYCRTVDIVVETPTAE
jgi:outer membrane protein OmpA-like peptidoglycan-associated protein